jgi:hypothetical protein
MEDEDVPWGSPAIREGYEAALGKYILAFNQIDHQINELIGTVLQRLDKAVLSRKCYSLRFEHKLLVLELLTETREGVGLKYAQISLLQRLAKERNSLAHGHFEQNPFDGTFEIVNKTDIKDYPLHQLVDLTAQAEHASNDLRLAYAFYAFIDIKPA